MTFEPALYKDPALVKGLARRIHDLAEVIACPVKLMHICGTHEHELGKYALRALLPDTVELLAGPGCPVCVCSAEHIDQAIRLAMTPGVTLTSFGDMLAVPGGMPLGAKGDRRMSLLDAHAQCGDVRAVYSVFDAVRLAGANLERQVVFFSVGFETTVVATAAALKRGAPDNFTIVEANYYTPPATHLLPDLDGFDISGFLLPGHAAAVTGLRIYEHLPERGIACASAGFEPVDILAGIAALLEQIASNEPRIDNGYPRVIRYDGNQKALGVLAEVFEPTVRRWRGIGDIPGSGFALSADYRSHSAAERYSDVLAVPFATRAGEHPRGCLCASVTLGRARPKDCPLFAFSCTPENPYGPCMVSHEGTCRAWYQYGMGEDVDVAA